MYKYILPAVLCLTLHLGCQKSAPVAPETPEAAVAETEVARADTVEVVPDGERSAHFLAVHRQLELGGTLYGYMDVEGDVTKLATFLQSIAEQNAASDPAAARWAEQDFGALATMLGFTDVKAIGVSSVPEADGFFRNRMFFYAPGERHGLMAAFGGKPGPFKHVNLAPADACFYAEAEMDIAIAYRTVKDVVTRIAGESASNQWEMALSRAGEAAALSIIDLIYGLKGHSALVLRLDPATTTELPGPQPLSLPGLSLLICIDGVGPVIEKSLEKSPLFQRTVTGARRVYEFAQPLPVEGIKPVFVSEGGTLYFATSLAFHDECRELKTGLAQTEDYQRAVAQLGTEGNGLSYCSPRFFEQLRRIESLNPHFTDEQKATLNFVFSQMPQTDRPLVAVRSNHPDGILVRSYLNRSHKQDVAMFSAYNPMTVGLLAAMAVPAFQKVRMASQEKAVMNNLRMLAAAADQYYLENGKTSATWDDLVGTDRYIREVQPVAGEDYREITFKVGEPLTVQLPDGREITYEP